MKKNNTPILWGLVFVIIGILIFLRMINVINFSIWGYLFPSILVFIGISSILNSRRNIVGYIFLGIGILIFIDRLTNLDVNYLYIIPLTLIVIGLSFFYKMFSSKRVIRPNGNAIAIFTGREDKNFSEDFSGMSITCIFGSYQADLREHKFVNDLSFNIFTMFGGTEIIVPDNVNVIVEPTAIFGGIDSVCSNKNDNEFTVHINALCLFGGIDIANYKGQKK